MAQRIKHKVGDTFDAAGTLRNAAGQPINLTTAGITISSAMRAGRKLFRADVAILDQANYPGQFQISRQTDDWPADDELTWDIQFRQGSHVISSQTTIIVTLEDVTPTA